MPFYDFECNASENKYAYVGKKKQIHSENATHERPMFPWCINFGAWVYVKGYILKLSNRNINVTQI